MPSHFDAPLDSWHDCNYYCRGAEHCDINYQWWSGAGDGPGFQEDIARRFYGRYGARFRRAEPAREIRPTAADVPAGHTLADFREAWLIWFEKK